MDLPLQWQTGGGANGVREDRGAFGTWCRNLACTGSHQTFCTFTAPQKVFCSCCSGYFFLDPVHMFSLGLTWSTTENSTDKLPNSYTPKSPGSNSSIVTEAWRLSSQIPAAKWKLVKKMHEVDVFPFTLFLSFLLEYFRNLSSFLWRRIPVFPSVYP